MPSPSSSSNLQIQSSYPPAAVVQPQSTSPQIFSLFPNLPWEMRAMIFEQALPGPRVVELTLTEVTYTGGVKRHRLSSKDSPSNLFYVNHEAHEVAQKAFPVQLRKFTAKDRKRYTSDNFRLCSFRTRINPEIDTIFFMGHNAPCYPFEVPANEDLLRPTLFSREALANIQKAAFPWLIVLCFHCSTINVPMLKLLAKLQSLGEVNVVIPLGSGRGMSGELKYNADRVALTEAGVARNREIRNRDNDLLVRWRKEIPDGIRKCGSDRHPQINPTEEIDVEYP